MKRVALLLVLAIVGCGRARVETTAASFTGPLPPPLHVIVSDFAIGPDEVRLDRGVSAEFMRAAGGTPAPVEMMQVARDTQAALAEQLTSRLIGYGLPAQRLPAAAVPPPRSLLVQGQIVSVDEGNRTRRNLLGFGAGKSSVTADMQLYYVANPAQPQFLQAFDGSANSGRMPGAVGTMGVGAATGEIARAAAVSVAGHAASETLRTTDTANARRLADGLARQVGDYAVNQGWVAPAALR